MNGVARDLVTGVLKLYNCILQNEMAKLVAKYRLNRSRITRENYITLAVRGT